MKSALDPSGTPWYLNSWPWFIVILMTVSIIASVATVVIAYRYGDVDVRQRERVEAAERSLPSRPSRSD
jgi:hypothetical protein